MKKILLTILVTALTATGVHAQEAPDPTVWDGESVSSTLVAFDGTIEIYTAADLVALHALWDTFKDGDQGYKGWTIKLMNDLDMDNHNFNGHTIGWNDDNKFGGTFDGQGHIIRNLKIHGKDNNRGLFGKMDNGKVMNLKLVDVDIRAGDGDDCHIGALCGRMYNHSTITHCAVVGGSVRAYESDNDEFGAICGYMTNNHNSIEYCYSDITVEADAQVGGLVGKIEQGDDNTSGIFHSYFSGTVIHYGDDYFASIAGERYSEKLQNNFYLYRDDGVKGTGWDKGSADPRGDEIAACTDEELKQPFLFSIYNDEYTLEGDQYIYPFNGYPELKVFLRYNVGDSFYNKNIGYLDNNAENVVGGHVRILNNDNAPSFKVCLEKTAGGTGTDFAVSETSQAYFNDQVQLTVTGLGQNIFENLGVVNTVTIPATVDSIAYPQRHQVQNAFILSGDEGAVKDGALYSLKNRYFITVPKTYETVTVREEFADKIADYAFENMSGLKTIYIDTWVPAGTLVDDDENTPTTVVLDGDNIFAGCPEGLDVFIKDGTTNQLFLGYQGPGGYGYRNADKWKLFYSDYQDVENHMFSYFPINRNPGGMSTLMLGYPVELPEGVTAWWAGSLNDGKVKLRALGTQIVPALTPVLLAYEGTTEPLYLSHYEGTDPGAATDYENNLFKGSVDPGGHTMTSSEMMSNFFTLGRPSGDTTYDHLGFYRFRPANHILPAYVAWLAREDLPSSNGFTLTFDDIPTAIQSAQLSTLNVQPSTKVYTVQGVRIDPSAMQEGTLYIVNGKKLIK
ncbi:MAG: hypothetical protein J6W24_05895 [Prevotella sp.]|nr:hypothetical protein [Prevotella sp.]